MDKKLTFKRYRVVSKSMILVFSYFDYLTEHF